MSLGGAALSSLRNQKKGPWRQDQEVSPGEAAPPTAPLASGLLGTLRVSEEIKGLCLGMGTGVL